MWYPKAATLKKDTIRKRAIANNIPCFLAVDKMLCGTVYREIILGKLKAIEGFVLVASIAMGFTQILSLSVPLQSEVVKSRYLRTVVAPLMAAKLRKMAKSPALFPPPEGGRKQHNAFPVYPG